jgi:hypothetical protein
VRQFRRVLVAALVLLSSAAPGVAAAADAPRISRPRPAPPGSSPNVPPLPPAMIDNNLAIGGDEVKARKLDTRLSVDVRVNGRGPYKFVVDSGADTSAVGLRIAHNLQLPLGTPVILNGMTSRELVDRVKVDQLGLGPSIVRNLELPALRELDLGGDGLIGIDALVHQRLLMDFDKRVIKVEDARTPVKALPGEIVITGYRRRGQLILTEVRAAHLRLDAVIDTGSEVTIGNIALRDKLLRKGRAKFFEVEAIGVTGVPVKLQLATIAELQLGPITLHDVPMAFADVPPFKLFGLADGPALLLGTDILENFQRVSLDFRARKVRFQLKRCELSVIISTAPTQSFTSLRSSGGIQVCGK